MHRQGKKNLYDKSCFKTNGERVKQKNLLKMFIFYLPVMATVFLQSVRNVTQPAKTTRSPTTSLITNALLCVLSVPFDSVLSGAVAYRQHQNNENQKMRNGGQKSCRSDFTTRGCKGEGRTISVHFIGLRGLFQRRNISNPEKISSSQSRRLYYWPALCSMVAKW